MAGAIEQALARHRAIAGAALAVLVLLAWAWIISGAGTGMAPGLSLAPARTDAGMMDMPMPPPGWSVGPAALLFAMWWTMMAAMMLPSAAPTILLHARVAGSAGARPATGSFLAGYLAAWGACSAVAVALQIALQRAGLVAPGGAMASQSRPLSAALLVAAGLYQLSPLKQACLRQCRSPAQFLARHFRPGASGAWRMGALHGVICVGCCWLLMALLFVGGVMNIAWIAILTLMVAAEKLLPHGRAVALLSGLACLAAGLWLGLA